MIAKVVPAVRLPYKASEAYDYTVPDSFTHDVRHGSVVIIPFAGRTVAGLVISVGMTSERDKPLKEIAGLTQGLAPFPNYTVELWTRLAKEFCTTLPRFVWTALPTVPARAIVPNVLGQAAGSLPQFPARYAQNSRDSFQEGVGRFAFINNPGDALKIVKESIAKTADRQILIIVPTVDEAITWSKVAGNASIYHSSLATGEKYSIACGTANGSVKIVVGTKSAVFLPFADLASIVILSAGSSSHLQEDSDPRFDARVIAAELAKASGAKLIALDALPPLGMTPKGSNGQWSFANDPRSYLPIVHDLRDAAKAAKARVLLCDKLLTAISETFKAGGRSLVILNRRGVSTAYVCKDCGAVISCPNCAIPLTVHQDRMSCFACENLYPLPDICPKCEGTTFKPFGSGSKALYEALKKRHPLAKIIHIDRDSWETNIDDAQIVVGTTAVMGSLSLDPKPFNLVADALMGAGQARAGIWSTENSARILRALAHLVTKEGEIHVQTFDPISTVLNALGSPFEFLDAELAERIVFGYPPAKTLITIYGAGYVKEKLWSEALAVVERLRINMPALTCSNPQWSRPMLFRDKYRLTISLRSSHGQDHHNIIQYMPADFYIEVRNL